MMRTRSADMAARITDKLVRDRQPPAQGNRITYDAEVKGFGVRVTAAGARAFVLNYRLDGRERRYTIGAYPDWSVAAAREEARRLKREVDQGRDPMGERHDERAAPTVADLAMRYVERHLPSKRPKSQREDRDMIQRIVLPRLGRLRVANVRHADVEEMHRALKGTPYRANRTLALLSKMFSLAVRWEWRGDNPVKGIERYPEERRTRHLSPAELARLSVALAGYPNPTAANALRFLLLTGARKGEALAATWDQLDLERGVWTKPSAHTKQKREHRVLLNAAVLALLADQRTRAVGEHVFPGRRPGQPLDDLKAAWAAITRAAGLEGVRVHDLRHSYASILASAGLSLPIIGALLGHTQPATTARYAHLFDDPLREATERVGTFVGSAGKEPGGMALLRRGSRS